MPDRTVLHVSKETARVIDNRNRAKLPSFGRFRKGLMRVYEFDIPEMYKMPKGFWHGQYDLLVKGVRDGRISDNTFKALEWCETQAPEQR